MMERYVGDVPDPRGGVPWIVPKQAQYWKKLESFAVTSFTVTSGRDELRGDEERCVDGQYARFVAAHDAMTGLEEDLHA